jgi:hypothetical protein
MTNDAYRGDGTPPSPEATTYPWSPAIGYQDEDFFDSNPIGIEEEQEMPPCR